MNDYKNLLILSYFYQNLNAVRLSKLQQVMGFTISQLEDRLTALIASGMLELKETGLSITPQGIQTIVFRHLESYPFERMDLDGLSVRRSY